MIMTMMMMMMMVYRSKMDQDGSFKKKMFSRISTISPVKYHNSETPYVLLGDENLALTRKMLRSNSQQDQRKKASATTEIARTTETL